MNKSEETKELIETTFLNLLAARPLNEISVNDVTEKCGLNRNTFYYHFKNIPDLLESVARGMVDRVLAEHPPRYETLEECFIAAMKLAKDNELIIYHIYNSANRVIFERHLWHVIDYTVNSFVECYQNDDKYLDADERSVLEDFFRYECFGFAIEWINKGMPEGVMERVKTLIDFMLARTEKI